MFPWIGLALLSVSWLVGLGYYHEANGLGWTAAVASGTLCLIAFHARLPSTRVLVAALLLSLPACYVAPWPYRSGMVLLAAGLAAETIGRLIDRWTRRRTGSATAEAGHGDRIVRAVCRLGVAMVVSGSVLIFQGLGLEVYIAGTARSHELPGVLARTLGVAAQALGIDSAVFGSNLAAFSMRTIHNLGATWELLLDPASFCFLLGGLVLIAWRVQGGEETSSKTRSGLSLALALVLPVLAWLPFRAALLVAAYLHEVLRVDYDAPLQAMKRFWSTPTHLLLLLPAAMLAWRLVPLRPRRDDGAVAGFAVEEATEGSASSTRPVSNPHDLSMPSARRRIGAVALVSAGVGLLTAAIVWDPVGSRKAGRVVIEEYHPEGDKQWERTDKPFDTTWYGHLSGYNYYCIYDYMTRYYDVVRRTEPLNDAALADCDVLIVKVPTRPYSNHEIEAIVRFVDRGGGLMLVGEHTNVFHTGTYLNAIARRFGFTFRYDCLFGVDKVFEQRYRPPVVPHPIVQHVSWMDFATSCSIAPERSVGRAAIRSVGLKNLMADYHVSNFYPKPDDSPEMRYGAFVQLWTMRYGRGRIAAFTDSTIFSNFCVFEPGKKELWMGMVEWLNHQAPGRDPRWPLTVAGTVLALVGLRLARRWPGARLVLVASGTFGWTAAVLAVRAYATYALPYPEPIRPYVQVNLDRTVSAVRLPRNGFISIDSTDYGVFERWILRLGYFTARRTHPEVLDGDLIVLLEPTKPIPPEYRAALVRFVDNGGKLLVVDSPPSVLRRGGPSGQARLGAGAGPAHAGANSEAEFGEGGEVEPGTDPNATPAASTTNALIEPFGMSVDHAAVVGDARTSLISSEGWPTVPSCEAVVVRGGRPFAWVGDQPVGASLSVGNRGGSVTVVGFGARFREDRMGGSADIEPDQVADKTLLHVYEWEYSLLRAIVEGKPLGREGGPPRPTPGK